MTEVDESEPDNDNICLFPGCERPAVDSRDRGDGPSHQARYCDLDEHDAGSLHEVLNKAGSEDAPV